MNLFKKLKCATGFAHASYKWRDLWIAFILGWARHSPLNSRTARGVFVQRLFRELTYHPHGLKGRGVAVDTSDLGQLITLEEIFVDNSYDFSLITFTPTAILDCGAHVGYFSMLALTQYPQADLVAFEPNPENAVRLRAQLNSMNRAQVIEAAVGPSEGVGWLIKSESNSGSLIDKAFGGAWPVRIASLISSLETVRNKPTLIKIDIEGEECSLIPTIAPYLPSRCAIYYETHEGDVAWKIVTMALEKNGFTTLCIRNKGQYRDGYACRM